VAVPVHHGNGITGLDPGFGEHIGQARDPLDQSRIGVAQLVAIDDFPGLLITGPGHEQAFDQQRILVRTFGGRDNTGLQHTNPFL